jgi:hypothetical protein
MAIRILVSQAKKLGYTIKNYKFIKNEKTLQPIIEKSQTKLKIKRKKTKNKTPLKRVGNIYKLDLDKLK